MGENDAHPLTDEQLDALVDELQDRLGDSTARKVGRRGVLAALGLATLGTGSASAQASGSVGTASSPVDVEGYDVTASNSFTDPAGVQHTGELADISDVGSGTGQWQEVNSGSNIEPIDGETIGTGSEDVDVGTVSTEEETIGIPNPSGNSTGDNIPELANRRVAPELTIQPRGGDEVGSAAVYPSGTEDRSHFLVANSSDVSNYGGVKWEINDTVADIEGFYKGSGTEPDRLRIKDFPIGIPLINTGGLRPEQGTPTDPSNLFLSVESDNTATGIQTTATDITADNTSQPLYEATDPPFMGLHIITGQYNVGDNTFCDLVIQIRNSTVTPVQKEVGTGSVGPRNYSLDGATFEVAIDETTSNVYNLTDTFIGGGT